MKRLLVIIILALMFIGMGLITYSENQIEQQLPISQKTLYRVDSGSSFNKVLVDLEQRDWLEHKFWLKLYAKLNPQITGIKAGTYQIPANASLKQLFAILVSGAEHQFSITFVEGSTFKEWLNQLAETQHIHFTLADMDREQILKLLTKDYQHPEGLFFPDTYSFTAGSKDIDILKQAHQRMLKELADSWQNKAKDLPYNNSYEALIMASMIEKETAQIDEQPLIAAVFITRLAKNMRLQTDPTIIYGLGDRYTGDITYANMREKTAYNTYRINGMPPTPIAMPGKSAIEASLHPANSKYLYFVSKGNGEHYFSTTLKEHNKAVDKYIRGKK
ncbi:endolytic transglycosylase MltG [Thalassotalea sp. ND16A]|uniref:endolytic transglycosylase MltG n=1 Tax=Thalassotalea sp. ND16A TaxID=1535422 RepID=UPI000519F66B|nr:endolytic transglycosylase MltG [Thalassotalea sp. ND16A]KGJ92760.1 hypothetical protein ND16A_1562 [Thalassotalea sp. ND16A]